MASANSQSLVLTGPSWCSSHLPGFSHQLSLLGYMPAILSFPLPSGLWPFLLFCLLFKMTSAPCFSEKMRPPAQMPLILLLPVPHPYLHQVLPPYLLSVTMKELSLLLPKSVCIFLPVLLLHFPLYWGWSQGSALDPSLFQILPGPSPLLLYSLCIQPL